MISILFFLFLAFANAAPATNGDGTLVIPTVTIEGNPNITKYLKASHRASLNFACQIPRITVTPNSESVSAGLEDPLTQIELEDHLGEPTNIEWAHVMQIYFGSTDPRGQDRQISTLGGDLGEFLIVMSAIEKQLSVTFNETVVLHKLRVYLTVMSREKFYFDIDIPAINHFKSVCNCPQLNIADPPDSKKTLLLNATRSGDAHGNEFFKKVLTNAEPFGIRQGLAEAVVRSFYKIMWNKADPLHRKIKFVLLKGDFKPKGFIMVKTPGYCNSQLLAPMISPELCSKQMGIYHGDAAVLLRTEMAGILLMKTPESKNEVVKQANEIAATALTTVLADHTEPIYTVNFEGLTE
jgi:hypothetical protein